MKSKKSHIWSYNLSSDNEVKSSFGMSSMANEKYKLTAVQIIYTIIFILLFPAVILFLAGDWFWIEGWIFSIWFIVMSLTVGIYS
jgi:hypothetical protein